MGTNNDCHDDLVGREFGPYVLKRHIGSGGSSHVYLADDRVFAREVAIKVARAAERREDCRREFERQSKTLGARIEHPSIVRIYGWDETDGEPYLAMEYVDGSTLLELLKQRLRLRLDEALTIARDAASALAAAHRRKVIHRDLKPENILVSRNGLAKLTDFYAEDGESLRNELGTFDYFGTPGYSAPEQVRGEEERIDGRADLFALGVVLYEMLEGQPLYGRGETSRVLARTLDSRGAPKLRASAYIPAPVAKLVNRLAHPSPKKRPADAVHALGMIEDCLKTTV